MKIKSKAYRPGDIRERRRFLWLPKSEIKEGVCVTRWLEYATYREKLISFRLGWDLLEFTD